LHVLDRRAQITIHVLRDRVFLFRPPQRDDANGIFIGYDHMSGHRPGFQIIGNGGNSGNILHHPLFIQHRRWQ